MASDTSPRAALLAPRSTTLPDHARPVHPRRPRGRRHGARTRARGATRRSPTRRATRRAFSAGSSRSRSTARGAVPGTLTLNVKRVRRREQPDRHRGRRAGRRPGPGGDPGRRASSPRSSRRRWPRRDLLVFDQRGTGSSGRLQLPGLRARRRARSSTPPHACAHQLGPRARLLPHVGLGRRHRGAARRVGLPEARALRRLLRHQGRARLRREVPGQRRVAGARLGRAARGLRRPATSRPSRPCRAVLGELCAQRRVHGHHHDAVGHDLANLVRRLRGAAAHAARSTRPAAARVKAELDQDGVLDILLAGDLNPTLRARAARRRCAARCAATTARCCACCCAPRA